MQASGEQLEAGMNLALLPSRMMLGGTPRSGMSGTLPISTEHASHASMVHESPTHLSMYMRSGTSDTRKRNPNFS